MGDETISMFTECLFGSKSVLQASRSENKLFHLDTALRELLVEKCSCEWVGKQSKAMYGEMGDSDDHCCGTSDTGVSPWAGSQDEGWGRGEAGFDGTLGI